MEPSRDQLLSFYSGLVLCSFAQWHVILQREGFPAAMSVLCLAMRRPHANWTLATLYGGGTGSDKLLARVSA